MNDNKHHIESEKLRKYLDGQLDSSEQQRLERKALDDPFMQEAMEGLEALEGSELTTDLADVSARLSKRTAENTRNRFGLFYKVAASLAIISVSIYLVMTFTANIGKQNEESLSMTEETGQAVPQETPVEQPQSDTFHKDINEEGAGETEQEQSDVITSTEKTKAEDRPGVNEFLNKQIQEAPAVDKMKEIVDTDEKKAGALSDADEKTAEVALAETTLETTETPKTSPPLKPTPEWDAAPASADKAAEVAVEPEETEKVSRSAKKGYSDNRVTGVISGQLAEAPLNNKGKIIQGEDYIYGVVYSTDDKKPLPAANVMVKGTDLGTTTDANGRFSLPRPADSTGVISIDFIGYVSEEVVFSDDEDITINMEPDLAQLSEMVIVGHGNQPVPLSREAEPENGIREFKKYIQENLRYPTEALNEKIEGRVILVFNVQPDGSVTHIAVSKGLGYGCDEEAVRLIMEGPAWQPAYREGVPAVDEVRMIIRFKMGD
ncbi:MAG: TonB family protein [Cyclobacteriaceae bacterium]|nr:TonB family protein [Cyclobacteriaceae bacterium]